MHRFLLATALLAAAALAAPGRIAIDESAIRAELKAEVTHVTLATRNSTGSPVAAQLRLEWLSTDDKVLATRAQPVTVAAGESKIAMAFPLPLVRDNEQTYLRLRYTLTPVSLAEMTGVVAFSAISPYAFTLQTASRRDVYSGTDYIVRVQSVHAGTHAIVSGVRFAAVLMKGKLPIAPASTRNDAEGTAVFTFAIPAGIGSTSLQLNITAHLGDYHQRCSASLYASGRTTALIETDKRLYQPGQTLHMRAIVSGAAGHAAAQMPVRVELQDAQGHLLRRERLVTSRFGIVHQDFELPATAETGSYSIEVQDEKGDERFSQDSVTVSRYELPTFTVSAKPDRAYYLGSQDAVVDIAVTYLHGKPVAGAKVLLGRPRISNGMPYSEHIGGGEADGSGHLRLRIPLGAAHAEFHESSDRYQDITYEAFCTDPSTGRSEPQRFDVRITHEPIHIYVTHNREQGGPLAVPVYVSTWYAGGTPAETTAAVQLGDQHATVRTNRYGIAKLMLDPRDGVIKVEARDAQEARGHFEHGIGFSGTPALRVRAARSIYRGGESVPLTIEAPDADLDLIVNAIAQDRLIDTRRVHLKAGTAHIDFPYHRDFRRLVTFTAFTGDERKGSVAVVYPDGAALSVNAQPERAEYKPGEEASVSFSVKNALGEATQSALGVSIVDQAVSERVKTDEQFGRRHWTGCAWCEQPRPESLTLDALYALDASRPLPDGFEISAEAVLAQDAADLEVSSSTERSWLAPFRALLDRQFKPIVEALDSEYKISLMAPCDRATVERIVAGVPRDPWGTPYSLEFIATREQFVLKFRSAGPDRTFATGDDFTAREIARSHFDANQAAIENALARCPRCLRDLREVREALRERGVLIDAMTDLTRKPYRISIETASWRESRELVFTNDSGIRQHRAKIPCPLPHIDAIRGALARAAHFPISEAELHRVLAAAGIPNQLLDPWGNPLIIGITEEDERTPRLYRGFTKPFTDGLRQKAVTIKLRATDTSSTDKDERFTVAEFEGVIDPVPLGDAKGTGALSGVVRSVTGAVLGGAELTLIADSNAASVQYRTHSDAAGGFLFAGVAPGRYTLTAKHGIHETVKRKQIPIADGYTTTVSLVLILNSARSLSMLSRSVDGVGTGMGIVGGIATPRVRQYFPETLLWSPELETDAQGRARLNVKLADNITTWLLSVTASTPDGRLARSNAAIRAFQPFFADLNPPQVLTAGDRIDLPVPVRNYLDAPQSVSVEMQPNTWSDWKGPSRVSAAVPANGTHNFVFPLLAKLPVDDARLRATAIGTSASDAIEKPVRVHPDGRRTVRTTGDLITARTHLTLTVPDAAIAGATRGELRLYPSAFATLRDAITGMLERPYGCGEQTASAGESNVIALRFARAAGLHDAAFEQQARRNIELARDRLKSYHVPGGGISYWGRGPADLAVTAYALRFLTEAAEFVPVDADLIQSTARWLLYQKGADGNWGAESAGSWATTAIIVRGLAAAHKHNPSLAVPGLAAIYADARVNPYVQAQFALAAIDLGDIATARKATAVLLSSAKTAREGRYWDTASATPFGGWGHAATLETTAAAVTALAHQPAANAPLIRAGILYLLRNRDSYGVWYSTQATVATMQALAAVPQLLTGAHAGGALDIVVNGKPLRRVTLSGANAQNIDLSSALQTGANDVELIPVSGSAAMIATAAVDYWTPWNAAPKPASDLSLNVTYDRTSARAGDSIECRVSANRRHGYGMLLAEIGLPPGADVDRDSLEALLRDPQWHLYRYEVQPDHLVLYLWPGPAGVDLRFSFRARYAISAQSAPSLLYDYYNPEASADVAPVRFDIVP